MNIAVAGPTSYAIKRRLSIPPLPTRGKMLGLSYNDAITFRHVVHQIRQLEADWDRLKVGELEQRLVAIETNLTLIYGRLWKPS